MKVLIDVRWLVEMDDLSYATVQATKEELRRKFEDKIGVKPNSIHLTKIEYSRKGVSDGD